MKKTSEAGKQMIKDFEGCRLKAYKLPGEIYYTVGYGSCGKHIENRKYTKKEIEALFEQDIKIFEERVNYYDTKYDFNQNEFDSLVSFAYNIGSINGLTFHGGRTKNEIAEAILLYDKDSRLQTLEGLKKRRKKEHDLFLTPVETIMESSLEVIGGEDPEEE